MLHWGPVKLAFATVCWCVAGADPGTSRQEFSLRSSSVSNIMASEQDWLAACAEPLREAPGSRKGQDIGLTFTQTKAGDLR